MKQLNIGYAGLTHLGLNYLAASAQKGFKVIGLDFNKDKINKLKKFNTSYEEPNLKNTIYKNKKRIFFTSNFSELKKCQLVFISEDVDTDDEGNSNYNSINKLIKNTSKHLNKKAIMIILSQIKPGFTRNINFDKKRLYYQVETLIFGNAIKRALNPERIIVGCKNPKNTLNKLFLKYLLSFKCPIIKMRYESAEFAKISINMLLASTITTTNMLSQICEKISADWYEIIPSLKLDERIGTKAYLTPGLGISGGNIERDISTVHSILKKYNKPKSIVKAFQKNSNYAKSWVFRILKRERILKEKNFSKIAVLGLAYKINTSSIKNSPTINLLKKINSRKIKVYDPKVKLNNKIKNCTQVNNVRKLVNNSKVIILMTPWPEFKKVEKMLKKNRNTKITIIDPYRIINLEENKNKYIKYLTLGK